MVGKIHVLVVLAAFAILFLAPMAVSAAECGDGVCERGEGCVSCQADCGACDGAVCFIDSNCASNICCNGACAASCITSARTEGSGGGTGMFFSNPVNVILLLGVLIAIVAGAIVYAIFFRKKKHEAASDGKASVPQSAVSQ